MVFKTRTHQSGFTLFELVIVLVILGILAAVAIPKYVDMRKEARRANILTLAAHMQQTATSLNLAWHVQGKPANVMLNGVAVPIVASGYPSPQYWDMPKWVEGMTYPFSYGSSGWNATYHPNAGMTTVGWADSLGACWVTYDSNNGTVTTLMNGC